jgi:two-component system OmpR family response regulator
MELLSVLVIDDDLDGSALIKAHLTRYGYSVMTAATLKEGIKLFLEFEPETLFLDHNLPDGLGWGMAPEMQRFLPGMRIILLTAFDAPPYPLGGNGLFKKLEKPFSFTKLDSVLENPNKVSFEIYDSRYATDPDNAKVMSVCTTLDEAMNEKENYGKDCVIVQSFERWDEESQGYVSYDSEEID